MASLATRLQVRAFLFYARFRRGMTLGVRAAVFDAQDRVLLVRHGYLPGWYLPGGGVEAGETMRTALDRELMEEAGIRLDAAPALLGIYLNRAISRRDHVAVYVCRSWTPVREPPRSFEIAERGFFPLDALPAGTSAGTRRRIAEIMTGGAQSEEW